MVRVGEALKQLLRDCHGARPEDLPDLAMRVAPLLGLREIVVYAVDYGQVRLMPFAGPTTPHRESLSVDGTVAGRAFGMCEPVEVNSDGAYRLWVPMSDCSHRLGVVELVGDQSADEPVRAAAEAVATILCELMATRRQYGDAIEFVRRRMPMQVATEIVWSLLPPLTFATDAAVVTGILEPAYDVGGDAFDYAINGDVMHVALFDAVGHGIAASTLTTVALNAYRNARRCGLDLLDTARSVDKWVSAQFPDLFVTAVLGELNLNDGTLRYICAGHPAGLLLREGRLVRELSGPTSLPLGLMHMQPGHPDIVEEALQPGDHVLMYTDGVVEARSADGTFFGQQRLVDLVTRTLADRTPAPETMRRLVRAILAHQYEQLQDDATALLLAWSGRVG